MVHSFYIHYSLDFDGSGIFWLKYGLLGSIPVVPHKANSGSFKNRFHLEEWWVVVSNGWHRMAEQRSMVVFGSRKRW